MIIASPTTTYSFLQGERSITLRVTLPMSLPKIKACGLIDCASHHVSPPFNGRTRVLKESARCRRLLWDPLPCWILEAISSSPRNQQGQTPGPLCPSATANKLYLSGYVYTLWSMTLRRILKLCVSSIRLKARTD